MAANGTSRGSLRPHNASRSPSFVIIGLLVVIAIIGFNYWNVSTRNSELRNTVLDMTDRLRLAGVKRLSIEKRNDALAEQLKQCRTDTEAQKSDISNKEQELNKVKDELDAKTKELQTVQEQDLANCHTALASAKANVTLLQGSLITERETSQRLQTEVNDINTQRSSGQLCKPDVDRQRLGLLQQVQQVLGQNSMLQLQQNGVDLTGITVNQQSNQLNQGAQGQVQTKNEKATKDSVLSTTHSPLNGSTVVHDNNATAPNNVKKAAVPANDGTQPGASMQQVGRNPASQKLVDPNQSSRSNAGLDSMLHANKQDNVTPRSQGQGQDGGRSGGGNGGLGSSSVIGGLGDRNAPIQKGDGRQNNLNVVNQQNVINNNQNLSNKSQSGTDVGNSLKSGTVFNNESKPSSENLFKKVNVNNNSQGNPLESDNTLRAQIKPESKLKELLLPKKSDEDPTNVDRKNANENNVLRKPGVSSQGNDGQREKRDNDNSSKNQINSPDIARKSQNDQQVSDEGRKDKVPSEMSDERRDGARLIQDNSAQNKNEAPLPLQNNALVKKEGREENDDHEDMHAQVIPPKSQVKSEGNAEPLKFQGAENVQQQENSIDAAQNVQNPAPVVQNNDNARRVMPESNRGADDEEVENEQMEEYEAQKERENEKVHSHQNQNKPNDNEEIVVKQEDANMLNRF